MNNIKLRGWDDNKKQWIFHHYDLLSLLCTMTADEIILLKVTRYIGVRDKNNNPIYEGDYLVDRYPINDEDLSEGYNESLLSVMWCNKKHCWCVDVTFAKNGKSFAGSCSRLPLGD